eukprot:10698081-Heterocapsa_arctica.AAC.1
MVCKDGIANVIAEIALPLFEASNAQEAEAIASWVAIGSLEWALNRDRSLGFNPMPPDLSLGDSSIMAAAARGEAQIKAPKLLKWQRGQTEAHAFNSREVIHNRIPREMHVDADKNASMGADLVTLAKFHNIPPSHIVTRITLRQGHTNELGVEFDPEGTFSPWGLTNGMDIPLIEQLGWRDTLLNSHFLVPNSDLSHLKFSWEVPTI